MGNGKTGQTDGGNRHPDQVALDAKAAQLRAEGKSYQAIADAMGWEAKSTAYRAVSRALKDTLGEAPAEVRQLELERLDTLWCKAWEVLERPHLTVQHGKVVQRMTGIERHPDGIEKLGPDGKPIPVYEDILDDGPVLNAIDRLLRIQERRARLLGLDVPVKAHVTVDQVDPRDLELAEILREAKVRQAAEEQLLKGETPAGGETA
ncbi:hypothetical protein ACRYCC_26180 [Actinomadura scrupuli]|uniref:hypothetical protein n=1 Tax=Actinomadura scrupuli TaxID=559629 RepID=UPI003D982A97